MKKTKDLDEKPECKSENIHDIETSLILSCNTSLPTTINRKQLPWIIKRRKRRKLLDSIMIEQKTEYIYESRHEHAVKRERSSSGRFLKRKDAPKESKT